mgnify:CR=1 FL=1
MLQRLGRFAETESLHIDVVLEGELHIRAGGKTYIGKPGDVFFIPSGASIEFGTPSSVRFVYVTYPANWAG